MSQKEKKVEVIGRQLEIVATPERRRLNNQREKKRGVNSEGRDEGMQKSAEGER